jgi:hypothetical protein
LQIFLSSEVIVLATVQEVELGPLIDKVCACVVNIYADILAVLQVKFLLARLMLQFDGVIERAIDLVADCDDGDARIFLGSWHVVEDRQVHILACDGLVHEALEAVGLDFETKHGLVAKLFDLLIEFDYVVHGRVD